MVKKIWNPSDILEGRRYFIMLCQNDEGWRYFDISDAENSDPAISNDDCIYTTGIVDNDSLRSRAMSMIAHRYKLKNGEAFYVDPHNIWFSEAEMEQFYSRIPIHEVDWSTPQPPRFPPK